MIKRFKGRDGKPRLIAALRSQQIVRDDEGLAKALASAVELIQVEPKPPHNEFIQQNGADNDIYLILCGRVSIRVNHREMATRQGGDHVGEMALIDPRQRRCASVIALEQTVLAKITEARFTAIANAHPELWRRLALELANRLRERAKHVKAPNPRPVVFIGSSAESREVAWEIRDGLSHEDMTVEAWTDDIFQAPKTTIETLERQVQGADFGVLVVTGDDMVTSRRRRKAAPRDNVLWEHGLFTGGLGRERTFIVKPRGEDIKMPSDLLGVTPLDYDAQGPAEKLRARLGPVINGIRKAVNQLGPRLR